ncbi:hypothetical protein EMCG_02705 [[Emmonsia] crescens]|uniref:Uncharacterized protein n=1 Tax=[Emmonsia] crescens TaxID=73230 RepID=A0A0G2HY23_9EURO|nr:hypothetical protein EMCG_02705 [Emmonsia crescens UAMH 3008]
MKFVFTVQLSTRFNIYLRPEKNRMGFLFAPHELVDLINWLRRAGLSSIPQLLQTCGALVHPLCNRDSYEVKGRVSHILQDQPEAVLKMGKFSFASFLRSIKDFGEMSSVIDDASAAMGLNGHKEFCKDVLSIEICGPNRAQL